MKDILFLLFGLVMSHPIKTLDELETRLKTYQNFTGISDETYAQLWNKVLAYGMLGTIWEHF